jgi:hypothetical protein
MFVVSSFHCGKCFDGFALLAISPHGTLWVGRCSYTEQLQWHYKPESRNSVLSFCGEPGFDENCQPPSRRFRSIGLFRACQNLSPLESDERNVPRASVESGRSTRTEPGCDLSSRARDHPLQLRREVVWAGQARRVGRNTDESLRAEDMDRYIRFVGNHSRLVERQSPNLSSLARPPAIPSHYQGDRREPNAPRYQPVHRGHPRSRQML